MWSFIVFWTRMKFICLVWFLRATPYPINMTYLNLIKSGVLHRIIYFMWSFPWSVKKVADLFKFVGAKNVIIPLARTYDYSIWICLVNVSMLIKSMSTKKLFNQNFKIQKLSSITKKTQFLIWINKV